MYVYTANNMDTVKSDVLNGSDFVPASGSYVDYDDYPCFNIYCVDDDTYIDILLESIEPSIPEWVFIVAHCIVFIAGLLGNLLVCLAVYRNKSMRTVTNYLIVNLAIADFMVILFCLPSTVAMNLVKTWILGTGLCKILSYLQAVSISVSVLTLTVISIERWYAICFPLKQFKATSCRTKKAIVVIWVISLTFDIPELAMLRAVQRKTFTECVPDWSDVTDTAFTIFRIIILYVTPLAFMSFTFHRMSRVLWSSSTIPGDDGRQLVSHQYTKVPTTSSTNEITVTQGNNAVDFQQLSRRKAVKLLAVVVIMFALCYLPIHVHAILNLFMRIPRNGYIDIMVLTCHWLPFANSAMNPIIYNFMSEKFRKEFANVFQCCCCFRRSGSPTTSSITRC